MARRIDPSRRRDGLTWSHHAEVAGLEPDEADAVLAEEDRPPESVFDFVQGITAVALLKPQQDTRLVLEGKAKVLLEKVSTHEYGGSAVLFLPPCYLVAFSFGKVSFINAVSQPGNDPFSPRTWPKRSRSKQAVLEVAS